MTDQEKRLLYSERNPRSFSTFLNCCNENGFYISQDGYHCYPVQYPDGNYAFVCICQNPTRNNHHKILEFHKGGSPMFYTSLMLKYYDGIWPNSFTENEKNVPIIKFTKLQNAENWYFCEIDGKKWATSQFGSIFNSNFEKNIFNQCANFADAMINLLVSHDLGIKYSTVIDVTDCSFIDQIYRIDSNGAMLTTKLPGLEIESYIPANPEFSDCAVLRGIIGHSFCDGYVCYRNRNTVELSDNSLTWELFERASNFTVFAKLKEKNKEKCKVYEPHAIFY